MPWSNSAPRGVTPRVHVAGDAEEEAVAGHREEDPRATEDEPVHAPEGRHEDRHRDEGHAGGPHERSGHVGGDAVLLDARHAAQRQHVEVDGARGRVRQRRHDGARHERARKGALRFAHLLADERHRVPRVVGEERLAHRDAACREEAHLEALLAEVRPEDRREVREGALAAREADDHEQRDRAHLEHREHVLDERAVAHAARVHPREQRDDDDRDELSARQGEPAHGEHDVRLADPQSDATEELGERDRHRGVEPGLDDQEERPPVEEGHEPAERFPQEDVLAARFGHHCAQLGVRERPEQRQRPAHEPEAEPYAGRRDVARHDRGRDEDAGPDHRAHDDRGRGERTEAPLESLHQRTT